MVPMAVPFVGSTVRRRATQADKPSPLIIAARPLAPPWGPPLIFRAQHGPRRGPQRTSPATAPARRRRQDPSGLCARSRAWATHGASVADVARSAARTSWTLPAALVSSRAWAGAFGDVGAGARRCECSRERPGRIERPLHQRRVVMLGLSGYALGSLGVAIAYSCVRRSRSCANFRGPSCCSHSCSTSWTISRMAVIAA